MAASVTLRPLYYPKAIQEQQTRIQLNTVQVKMQGLSDVVSNTASRGRPRRVLRVSTPACRKALTARSGSPYHEEMRQKVGIVAGTLVIATGLLGFQDAGNKPFQARDPALAPAATQPAALELPSLPE